MIPLAVLLVHLAVPIAVFSWFWFFAIYLCIDKNVLPSKVANPIGFLPMMIIGAFLAYAVYQGFIA